MADNKNGDTSIPRANLPPVDAPDQPMPLVTAPTQPETRGDPGIAGGNYEIVRNSSYYYYYYYYY